MTKPISDSDLHAWALIEAELAEIEGMKAENQLRERCGDSPAYGFSAFAESADTIRRLSEEFEGGERNMSERSKLVESLRKIAAMDYTRAATNGMGYDAVNVAKEALRKAGEL